ncbi:MAG: hypothetical protein N2053_08460 [Chitinispirillaceae bacterium]|nr:hypothetical protein [Chitinispirillaceae bacterium]
MKVDTQKLLKIINPIIGILFFFQAMGGIFHKFIPYTLFKTFHGPSGYILSVGILLHIILNRQWFISVFFKKSSNR